MPYLLQGAWTSAGLQPERQHAQDGEHRCSKLQCLAPQKCLVCNWCKGLNCICALLIFHLLDHLGSTMGKRGRTDNALQQHTTEKERITAKQTLGTHKRWYW